MASANELLLLVEAREFSRSGRARQIREDAGISQDELAEVCGVDGATISRWERGLRGPRGAAAITYMRTLRALSKHALREPELAARGADP